VGKWGSGEVGRWGSGEVGRWGSGENTVQGIISGNSVTQPQ